MGERAQIQERDPATGHFKPGNSVHRAVRKRRALKTILAEATDPADLQKILANGVKEALKEPTGQWALFFASKLVPAPKPEASTIDLPMDDLNGDPVAMGSRIMEAVGSGRINPEAASALLSALSSLNTMIETQEMKDEIEQLKEALSA